GFANQRRLAATQMEVDRDLLAAARIGGNKNSRRSLITSGSAGALESLIRRMNADHCVCLSGEAANSSDSATGMSSGMAVPLFSKVFAMAVESWAARKSNERDSNKMSKKSFMRLFSSPSLTIASNFSATALSLL